MFFEMLIELIGLLRRFVEKNFGKAVHISQISRTIIELSKRASLSVLVSNVAPDLVQNGELYAVVSINRPGRIWREHGTINCGRARFLPVDVGSA